MKRLFALLLVTCMVVSMLPMHTLAAQGAVVASAGTHDNAAHICEHCDSTTTWTAWGEGKTTLPTAEGHYYLTKDISVTAATISSGHVVLCLNGYTVTANGTSGNAADRFYNVKNGGSLTITDCTASGEGDTYTAGKFTGASNVGFNADSTATGTITIYDGIFEKNVGSVNGGVISTNGSAKLYVYGGRFAENKATGKGGGVILANKGANFVHLENAVFDQNQAGWGGAVYHTGSKSNSAPLTMEVINCTFTGNSTTSSTGAALCYSANAVVTIEGSTFANNIANTAGGAIRITGTTSALTIKNSSFTGNEGKAGAGAIWAGGNVTLDGVTMKNNVSNGTDIITGKGAITLGDKDASTKAAQTLTVKGNTQIVDNGANVAMTNGTDKIVVSDLASTAAISVAGVAGDVLTDAFEAADSVKGNFKADDATLKVGVKDGKLVLETAPNHTDASHKCEHCDTTTTWTPWGNNGETKLPTADGHYYLTKDISVTAATISSGHVVLCLNGYTVTANGTSGNAADRFYNVKNGGSLTITDCTASGEGNTYTAGKFTGASNVGFNADSTATGTITIYDGIFEKNVGSVNGGVISTNGSAKLYVYGGRFAENKATGKGGGVILANKGANFVHLENAVFDQNQAGWGGAVYHTGSKSNSAPLTMEVINCTFTGNSTTSSTGAALCYSANAVVTIEGSTFANNIANTAGGAIRITGTTSNLTVKDSTFTGNEGKAGAGAIWAGGNVTLDGVTMKNNVSNGTDIITGKGAITLGDKDASTKAAQTLTVKGNTQIVDNGANVAMTNGTDKIVVSDLASTAAISVAGVAGDVLTDAFEAADSVKGNFKTDDEELQVSVSNGALMIADKIVTPPEPAHAHKLCNNAACADHTDVVFQKWEKTDSLPSDGAWYLTEDVQMSGAVEIKKDLTLCLNGHTVTAKSGVRHFAVTNGVTVTITDCADVPGGFTDGSNKFGGSVNVNAGGTLNLYAGSFKNNVSLPDDSSNGYGGAIYLQGTKKVDGVQLPGGVFNMYGGELSGNTANRGAAVYGAEGTTFYAENAKITGNTASQGALYMQKCTTTLKNTAVSGNTGANGSAACIFGGTAVLDGAKIENNHATSGYGALHLNRSGDVSLTVQGATVIANNTTGDSNKIQNLYMRQSTSALYLTVGALTEGANVGITMENSRLNANNLKISNNDVTAEQAEFLHSDNDDYVVEVVDGKAALTKVVVTPPTPPASQHTHCICGDMSCTKTEGAHKQVGFEAWNDPAKLPTSGNYYLECDVQLASAKWLGGNKLNLCLHGHTITAPQNVADGRAIIVQGNGVLSITDCAKTAGKIVGGRYQTGGAIVVWKTGTFNLYKGTLSGNTAKYAPDSTSKPAKYVVTDDKGNEIYSYDYELGNGGAVWLQSGTAAEQAVFNMYGGQIGEEGSPNVALKGAAVYLSKYSVFNMFGGQIAYNEATNTDTDSGKCYDDGNDQNSKGIIYVDAYGTFNMTGGTIRNNKATKGGAVYAVNDSTVNIGAVQITGNYAGEAGAMYLSKSHVTLTGTQITGNTAKNGSALCLFSSDVTMKDVKVENNHAESGYGAVHINQREDVTSNITVAGATVIANNTVGESKTAQNVYLRKLDGETYLTVDGLTEGANIGVTMEKPRVAANQMAITENDVTDQQAALLYSDAAEYTVEVVGGKACLATGHNHTVCAATSCTHGHEELVWTPWSNTEKLPTSGNYYLTVDVQLKNVHYLSAELKLCLNGHTITAAENCRVISVQTNVSDTGAVTSGKLDLTDCVGTGKLTGGSSTFGGAINVQSNAVLNIWGGNIEGNDAKATKTDENGKVTYSYSEGGGIYIQGGKVETKTYEKEVFDAETKVVSKETKEEVATLAGGVVNMYGGSISDNTANVGGAVRMAGPGKTALGYTYGDKTYKEDQADDYFKSQFHLYGGEITGNTAKAYAGAVAGGDTIISFNGGKISGNTAKTNGAIYANSKTKLTLSGNVQIGNNLLNSGVVANLYLAEDAKLTLGELAETARVSITVGKFDRFISYENEKDYTKNIVSDSAYRLISYKDKALYIENYNVHEHCLCVDGASSGCQHDSIGWFAWESSTALPTTAGYYFLTSDVQLSSAVEMKADVTLCLNGHTITAPKDSRAIAVSRGDTLTITDCSQAAGSIVGGNRTFGGAISVQSGAVLNLYAGNITGNTAPKSEGGAIYVQAGKFVNDKAVAGGIVNMYGGKLSGNTANLGAAIRLAGGAEGTEPATFNMYGGEISGNTSANGAVYATTGSVLNLQGGVITDNTATGNVGGVYVSAKETVILGGDIRIIGNTAKDKPSNLNLPGQLKVQAAGLTEKAKISVTAEKFDRFITEKTDADYSKNFVSDSAYRVISYKDNAVYLANSTEHQHCVCTGVASTSCDHENIVWVAWESATTLPITDGHYYLTQDVVMTNQIWVSNKNISLCLNGFTVKAAEGKRLISVQIGTTFNLTDCGATGKMTGGSSTYGGGINVNAGGVLNMYGGNLTGNASTDEKLGQGGAIYLQAGKSVDGEKISGGVFNMYGGKISENAASWGGAIFAKKNSQINVYGGTIEKNTAVHYGGAIYACEGITTNLGKATISGNFATTGGGAVYITGANSVLNINGTTFNNNSIDGYGGGAVFTQSTGTVITVNGATFNGNKATAGGGLYAGGNTTLTVDNSVFTGNSAQQGAAIYEQRATVTIGKVTMTGNTAKGKAAGIYIKAGSVVLDGVIIKNNTGSGSGTAITTGSDTVKVDGVSTIVYPTVEFKSGTISGHKGNSGGAILLQSKTQFTMSGGTITGNTAEYGGAIYVSTNATFTMTGGTISGNSVKTNGGGIYALRSTVEIKGGTIANNTAVKMGAGLFASGAKVTMTAGSITGNRTDTGTGGGAIATGSATVSGAKVGSTIQISGGSITNNYGRHGGAMLIQGNKDTIVTMTGGRISGNECKVDGGAIYVSTYTTFNQYGGTISNNYSAGRAGAIYHNNSKGNYKNVEFANNSAKSTAGTILINGATSVINMENVKIHDSVSGASAGGLCHQGKGMLIMKGCEVYNCVSAEKNDGGAIYISNNTPAEIYDTKIYNCYSGDAGGIWVGLNCKVLLDGMTIENNQAKDHGGGIMTRSYLLTIKNSVIEGNKCGQFGGGIGSYRFPYQGLTYAPASSRVGTTVENTVIRNNVAEGLGGGAYTMMGTKFNLTNVTFTGNSSGAEGGALWSQAELTVDGLTATGNVSSGQGYAVYLETANYDGHSYTNGYNNFAGDVIVKDNTNGDMFLGETTTIAVMEKGFGEKTHIEITLASGVLTQKVFGAYNYEGGNLVYTLTYGDRSLTDPEYDASLVVEEQTESAEEDAEVEKSGGDIWLYVGIGAVALVVLAVVLLVIKKKKSAAAEKK